jgi:hypothetical protein
LRVFPVFAIVGLALKAVAEAVSARRVDPVRRYARFAAGGPAAAAFFLTSSSFLAGRTQIWNEFAENSAKHLSTQTVNFVGLEVFLTYQHEARIRMMADPLLLDHHAAWKEHVAAVGRDMRAARWAVGAAFVLLLTLAVRGSPDWVAAVLGLGLMPMLLKPSDYYYSALLAYATLWPVAPGAGFALAAFTWATTVIPGLWPDSDARFAWLSLAAVAFVTGLTAAIAWHSRAGPLSAEPRGPDGEP